MPPPWTQTPILRQPLDLRVNARMGGLVMVTFVNSFQESLIRR